jgi:organic radical activating enzyme
MENKVICSKPFTTIHNNLDASYAPCCWTTALRSKIKENPNNTLPIDHFFGEDFTRLRKEMLIGEKTDFLNHYCGGCFEREELTGSSPRTYGENHLDIKFANNFNSDGLLKEGPIKPFLNLAINFYGNSCNLECYECNPVNSTSRQRVIKEIKSDLLDIGINADGLTVSNDFNYREISSPFDVGNKEQSDKIINNILEHIDIISNIEIVGGEPMLMKTHFEMLDQIIARNKSKKITLSYVSNMTLMNLPKMEKYFRNFQYTFIQWSVNALRERNHWLRYPTNWEQTVNNVNSIQRYFKKYQNGRISATITPSLLGITTLKETHSWLYYRSLIEKKPSIHNRIIKPDFLRTRNLPDELKEKIASDVKQVAEDHYNDLLQPRNQRHFELAIKYFDLLDKKRGTDWRSTFPEVAKYAN